MRGYFGNFKRVISLGLVVAFLATDVAYAAPSMALPPAREIPPIARLLSDPSTFEAPIDFASLKELHTGTRNTFIIHIQDAHSNVSGQQNLAGALDALMERYGVSLVLSEGGVNDCSLTPLKKIASPDIWKRVAKSYLMEGKLAGEEYLNLVSERPMKIIGIEDMDEYFASLEHYAALADRREKALSYLSQIRIGLQKIKNRAYPDALIEYEEKLAKDPGSFEKKIKGIWALAKANNVSMDEFGELAKLVNIQKKEAGINFDLANLEQAVLIEEIAKRGGQEDLERFMKKVDRLKGDKLSQFVYFQNTLNIAKAKGIEISKFENYLAYGDYLKQFSTVDLERLMDETQKAEDKVYRALLGPENLRLTRAVDRYTALLETAYSIQMTTRDFETFRVNEPDFATVPYLAFVNRQLAELGYYENILSYDDVLEKAKASLEAFYASVNDRDLSFIKNSARAMSDEKQNVVVLVTGGYHTQHLAELWRKEGYSYAVLTPYVSAETNQAKYERLLLKPVRKEMKTVETVQGEKKSDASLAQLNGDLAKKSEVRVELTRADGARLFELASEGARLAGAPETQVAAIVEAMRPRVSPASANKPADSSSALSAPRGARMADQGAQPEKDRRVDALRHEEVERLTDIIDQAMFFDKNVEELLAELRAGAALDEHGRATLGAIRERLRTYHPLIALRRRIKTGDRILTTNQRDLKALNSLLGPLENDRVIARRRQEITRILRELQLIGSQDAPLLFSYKGEKFAIGAGLDEATVVERLNMASAMLSDEMNDFLQQNYAKQLAGRSFDFTSYFGLSAAASATDDQTLLAVDLESLQAAKIARRKAEKDETVRASAFDRKEFDGLVRTAAELSESIGLGETFVADPVRMDDILRIRTMTEKEATSSGDARTRNTKILLDLADLFDYPKPWDDSAKIDELTAEIVSLDAALAAAAPKAADVERAARILETSFKDAKMFTADAFHARAAQQNGTIVSADATGFYGTVLSQTLKAQRDYAKTLALPESERRKASLRLSLKADDAIKSMMKEKSLQLSDELAELDHRPSFGSREGGDEIVFFIEGFLSEKTIRELARRTAALEMRVSLTRHEVGSPRRYAAAFTQAAGPYGEAFSASVEADNRLKAALKALGKKPVGGLVYSTRSEGSFVTKLYDTDGNEISSGARLAAGWKAGPADQAIQDLWSALVRGDDDKKLEYILKTSLPKEFPELKIEYRILGAAEKAAVEAKKKPGQKSVELNEARSIIERMAGEADAPALSRMMAGPLENAFQHVLPAGRAVVVILSEKTPSADSSRKAWGYVMDSGEGMPIEGVIKGSVRGDNTKAGKAIETLMAAGSQPYVFISQGKMYDGKIGPAPVGTPKTGVLFATAVALSGARLAGEDLDRRAVEEFKLSHPLYSPDGELDENVLQAFADTFLKSGGQWRSVLGVRRTLESVYDEDDAKLFLDHATYAQREAFWAKVASDGRPASADVDYRAHAESSLGTTTAILTSGRLNHSKGDTQYSGLTTAGYAIKYDEGNGLFILLSRKLDERIAGAKDGAYTVPLEEMDYIVFPAHTAADMRVQFPSLKDKIVSYDDFRERVSAKRSTVDPIGISLYEGTKYSGWDEKMQKEWPHYNNQQDNFIAVENAGVKMYAALDGMGGAGGGAVASRIVSATFEKGMRRGDIRADMTLEQIQAAIQSLTTEATANIETAIEALSDPGKPFAPLTGATLTENELREILTVLLQYKGEGLITLAEAAASNETGYMALFSPGMGATMALSVIIGNTLYYTQVGDARLYALMENGTVRLLTRDDSMLWDMVERYGYSFKDASESRVASVVNRAILGGEEAPVIKLESMPLAGVKRLFMTSDGAIRAFQESAMAADDAPLKALKVEERLADFFNAPDLAGKDARSLAVALTEHVKSKALDRQDNVVAVIVDVNASAAADTRYQRSFKLDRTRVDVTVDGDKIRLKSFDEDGGAKIISGEFIGKSVITIGRAEQNDFAIPSGWVSARHAELRKNEKGEWSLIDLRSTNGTKDSDGKAINPGEPVPLESLPASGARLATGGMTVETDIVIVGDGAAQARALEALASEYSEVSFTAFGDKGSARWDRFDLQIRKSSLTLVPELRKLGPVTGIRVYSRANEPKRLSEALLKAVDILAGKQSVVGGMTAEADIVIIGDGAAQARALEALASEYPEVSFTASGDKSNARWDKVELRIRQNSLTLVPELRKLGPVTGIRVYSRANDAKRLSEALLKAVDILDPAVGRFAGVLSYRLEEGQSEKEMLRIVREIEAGLVPAREGDAAAPDILGGFMAYMADTTPGSYVPLVVEYADSQGGVASTIPRTRGELTNFIKSRKMPDDISFDVALFRNPGDKRVMLRVDASGLSPELSKVFGARLAYTEAEKKFAKMANDYRLPIEVDNNKKKLGFYIQAVAQASDGRVTLPIQEGRSIPVSQLVGNQRVVSEFKAPLESLILDAQEAMGLETYPISVVLFEGKTIVIDGNNRSYAQWTRTKGKGALKAVALNVPMRWADVLPGLRSVTAIAFADYTVSKGAKDEADADYYFDNLPWVNADKKIYQHYLKHIGKLKGDEAAKFTKRVRERRSAKDPMFDTPQVAEIIKAVGAPASGARMATRDEVLKRAAHEFINSQKDEDFLNYLKLIVEQAKRSEEQKIAVNVEELYRGADEKRMQYRRDAVKPFAPYFGSVTERTGKEFELDTIGEVAAEYLKAGALPVIEKKMAELRASGARLSDPPDFDRESAHVIGGTIAVHPAGQPGPASPAALISTAPWEFESQGMRVAGLAFKIETLVQRGDVRPEEARGMGVANVEHMLWVYGLGRWLRLDEVDLEKDNPVLIRRHQGLPRPAGLVLTETLENGIRRFEDPKTGERFVEMEADEKALFGVDGKPYFHDRTFITFVRNGYQTTTVMLPLGFSSSAMSRAYRSDLTPEQARDEGMRDYERNGAVASPNGKMVSSQQPGSYELMPNYNMPGHAEIKITGPGIAEIANLGGKYPVTLHRLIDPKAERPVAQGERSKLTESIVNNLSQFIPIDALPEDSLSRGSVILRQHHPEKEFTVEEGKIYVAYGVISRGGDTTNPAFFKVEGDDLLAWSDDGWRKQEIFTEKGREQMLFVQAIPAGQSFVEAMNRSVVNAFVIQLSLNKDKKGIRIKSFSQGIVVRQATDEEKQAKGISGARLAETGKLKRTLQTALLSSAALLATDSVSPRSASSATPALPGTALVAPAEPRKTGSAKPEELSSLLTPPGRYATAANLELLSNNRGHFSEYREGRLEPQDEVVAFEVAGLVRAGAINERTLVILDSGHAHSIAAAHELAKAGWIVIPYFAHADGDRVAKEAVASMRQFGYEIARLNAENFKKNSAAPAALYTDAHRSDGFRIDARALPLVDRNRYDKVVWVTEGSNGLRELKLSDLKERFTDLDLGAYFAEAFRQGMAVTQAAIDPYPGRDEWEKMRIKRRDRDDDRSAIAYDDEAVKVSDSELGALMITWQNGGIRYILRTSDLNTEAEGVRGVRSGGFGVDLTPEQIDAFKKQILEALKQNTLGDNGQRIESDAELMRYLSGARLAETGTVTRFAEQMGVRLNTEMTPAGFADLPDKDLSVIVTAGARLPKVAESGALLMDTANGHASFEMNIGGNPMTIAARSSSGARLGDPRPVDIAKVLKQAAGARMAAEEQRTKAAVEAKLSKDSPEAKASAEFARLHRMGLRAVQRMANGEPVVLKVAIDLPSLLEGEKELLIGSRDSVKQIFTNVYFQFVDRDTLLPIADTDLSDELPSRPAATIYIGESRGDLLNEAKYSKAGAVLWEATDPKAAQQGAVPYSSSFIAAVLVARMDKFDDKVAQFIGSLVKRDGIGPSIDAAHIAAMQKVTDPLNAIYKDLSIKRIEKIAVDKFLEFTRMALKAIGAAA